MFTNLPSMRWLLLAVFTLFVFVSPANADTLSALFGRSNLISIMNKDVGQGRPSGCPSKWCACYLEKILEEAGYQTAGSYRARDYASYGRAAKPESVGAIMVMPHHIGVVTGQCADGRVEVLSGNHGNRVASGCYSPSKAIAWRKPVR